MNAKVNSIRMLAISGLSVMMLSQASATVTEGVEIDPVTKQEGGH